MARLSWFERGADWLARLALVLIVLNMVISGILGVLAILIWPTFRDLGSGPGGGSGVPMLTLFAATLLGVPSLLLGLLDAARQHWYKVGRLLAFFGPLAIMLSFFFLAHALDPCARGWADLQSQIVGIQLCEPYQDMANIHTRLHLLEHVLAPTVWVVIAYWMSLRKWHAAVIRFPVSQARSNFMPVS